MKTTFRIVLAVVAILLAAVVCSAVFRKGTIENHIFFESFERMGKMHLLKVSDTYVEKRTIEDFEGTFIVPCEALLSIEFADIMVFRTNDVFEVWFPDIEVDHSKVVRKDFKSFDVEGRFRTCPMKLRQAVMAEAEERISREALSGRFLEQAEQQAQALVSTLVKNALGKDAKKISFDWHWGDAEAYSWAIKAAAHGDPRAQTFLGRCFYDGRGVEENKAEAVRWFHLAAEQGDAKAQALLGLCCHEGHGVDENPEAAVHWWRLSADQGNPEAQWRLGDCYYNGYGVEENKAEGVEWFRKSASQDNKYGQFHLGLAYDLGEAVKQDTATAARWWRKAADQGYAPAQYRLARCLLDNDANSEEAINWLQKAAEQGDADAQYSLAGYYLDKFSVLGNPEGIGESVSWLLKAVNQGHPDAQCLWGVLLSARDKTEAIKYYQLAADHGSARGRYLLGECYFKGDGIEQNKPEAIKLYRQAAEQGVADAQRVLGLCYFKGDGLPKNKGEAVKWYRQAAEQGNAAAQRLLAACYAKGDGVPKDKAEADKWENEAKKQESHKKLGWFDYLSLSLDLFVFNAAIVLLLL